MFSWDEMTLQEAYNAIEEQKNKVENAAYWNYDCKVELLRKYEKLQDSINYLWENQRYFNDYNFMNEQLIKISQGK
jgi:Zn-dependent M32 family carboxypeptidase